MNWLTLIVAISLLLVWPSFADAQNISKVPSPKPAIWDPIVRRDPSALEVVAKALQAMGGKAAIGQIATLEMLGQTTFGERSSFVWQVAGNEYRLVSTSSSGQKEFNSGSGTPFRRENGKLTIGRGYADKAVVAPGSLAMLLSRLYTNQNYSLQLLPASSSDSSDTIEVAITNLSTLITTTSSPQIWDFSRTTGLPVRLQCRSFASEQTWPHHTDVTYTFSQFNEFNGIQFPTNIDAAIHSQHIMTYQISAVTLNAAMPSSIFTVPTEGAQ